MEYSQTGYVYFLVHSDQSRFKVGHTKYLLRRICEIGQPFDLESSFYISCRPSDRRSIEIAAHQSLCNFRHWHCDQSEWFSAKSIELAFDFAEQVHQCFEGASRPMPIPAIQCVSDIGQALALLSGSTVDHHRLGRIAIQIGDRTSDQIKADITQMIAATERLDLSCPFDEEIAEINIESIAKLEDQLVLLPFMTPEIRNMARLFPTLARPAFEARPDEDAFAMDEF